MSYRDKQGRYVSPDSPERWSREVRRGGQLVQRVTIKSEIARARDARERGRGLSSPKRIGEFNVSAKPGQSVKQGIRGSVLRGLRKVPKDALGVLVRVTFWRGGIVGTVELLTIAASFLDGLTKDEARSIVTSHVLRLLRSNSLRLSRRNENDTSETDAATIELFWV